MERTTSPSADVLSNAAIAAVITAASSRSSARFSSSATGTGAGAGAAGAGAATLFLFSNALIYLKQLIRMLIKISTRNTIHMPISVFMPAFASFSPVVYSGVKENVVGETPNGLS